MYLPIYSVPLVNCPTAGVFRHVWPDLFNPPQAVYLSSPSVGCVDVILHFLRNFKNVADSTPLRWQLTENLVIGLTVAYMIAIVRFIALP